MKIAVVGCGYVGLSNALLLAQNHQVIALDVLQRKVDLINDRLSPIADPDIERYLRDKVLTLRATTDVKQALHGANYVIIATPRNQLLQYIVGRVCD